MRAQDKPEQHKSAWSAPRAGAKRAAEADDRPAAPLLELQRSVGNAAVSRMLADGNPAVAGPAVAVQLMPNKRKRTGDEQVSDVESDREDEEGLEGPLAETAKAHLDQIAALVKACTCTPATKQEGRMTGELDVRGRRSREGDRPQQTLQHIAIRLLRSIKHLEDAEREKWAQDQSTGGPHTKSETEVQVMLVKGRLVIATNRNASITLLEKYLPEQVRKRQQADAMEVDAGGPALHGGHWMQDILLEEGVRPERNKVTAGTEEAIRRSTRARGKLHEVYQGARSNDVGGALHRVRAVISANITDSNEYLAELLTAEAYQDTVILLRGKLSLSGRDGSATMHAEQKHLSALAAAASAVGAAAVGPAVIRGQRRPCGSCWALFHLFSRSLDVPVDFSDKPGLYFHEGAVGAAADERLSNLVTAKDIEGRYSFAQLVTGIQRMNVSAKSTVAPADIAGELGVVRPKWSKNDPETGESQFTLDDDRIEAGFASASDSEVEDPMPEYKPSIGVLPEITKNVTRGQAGKMSRGEAAAPAPRVSAMKGTNLTDLTEDQVAMLDAARAAGASQPRDPKSRGGHAPKITHPEYAAIVRLLDEAEANGQKGMSSAVHRYYTDRGVSITAPAISKGVKTYRDRNK
jgi:hypothetical protein